MKFFWCLLPNMSEYRSKKSDSFSTRRRHQDLDVYQLSQPYFDLAEKTTGFHKKIKFLFKQTLKDFSSVRKSFSVFDMSYDEVENIRREACKDDMMMFIFVLYS